ncbi:MAG: hypothetical protein K9L86_05725 [Candidatus Omnitrophica bacterium]|nr:hypothetical protein [Candidatus Omnitrophota bacterium]
MIKKIIVIICFSCIICLNLAYSKYVDPDAIVRITRKITQRIYKDIISIKDEYEELKGFDENFYGKGTRFQYRIVSPTIEYIYCPGTYNQSYERVMELYCNPQPPAIHLRLVFLSAPCGTNKCDIVSICPDGIEAQIYIEEIDRYLIFSQRSGNAELDTKLMEIFRKHTKKYKTKEIPWE